MNEETNLATVGFRIGSYVNGTTGVGPIDDLIHIPAAMKKAAKVSTLKFKQQLLTEWVSDFWKFCQNVRFASLQSWISHRSLQAGHDANGERTVNVCRWNTPAGSFRRETGGVQKEFGGIFLRRSGKRRWSHVFVLSSHHQKVKFPRWVMEVWFFCLVVGNRRKINHTLSIY